MRVGHARIGQIGIGHARIGKSGAHNFIIFCNIRFVIAYGFEAMVDAESQWNLKALEETIDQ